jgi:ketosteroid isomerase-like protein
MPRAKIFQVGLARGNLGVNFDSGAFAPDGEWIPEYAPGLRSVYRGREGFVQFMRTWSEDFEDWSIRPEKLIDVGDDRVVALVHQRATGKASGVQVDLHMAFIFDLKEGRVIRVRTFIDPAEALKAVGMSEQDAHADSSA